MLRKTFLVLGLALALSGCSGARWKHPKTAATAAAPYATPTHVRLQVRANVDADGIDEAKKVLSETVVEGLEAKGVVIDKGADEKLPSLDLEIVDWDEGSTALRAVTESVAGEAEIVVKMKMLDPAKGSLLEGEVHGTSSGGISKRAVMTLGLSSVAAAENAGRAIVSAVATGKL